MKKYVIMCDNGQCYEDVQIYFIGMFDTVERALAIVEKNRDKFNKLYYSGYAENVENQKVSVWIEEHDMDDDGCSKYVRVYKNC